jgi:predicted AAA+ superfamily ATPase
VLDYIYPEEERRFFTDREYHLELLALCKTLLTQGIRKRLALNGFRRVGKTVILKEFLRRHLLEKTDGGVAVV